MFVHYFDPHFTYKRHPEFEFAGPGAGRLTGNEPIETIWGLVPDLTDAEIAFIESLYDEEIRHTDAGIGRLLATLAELGLDENTLVVLTADHGEEFLDHGSIAHGFTLYDEVTRVPLILSLPGVITPGTVRSPVSLISLVPTLLELLEIDGSGVVTQAESIAGLLHSQRPQTAPVFLEGDHDRNYTAVVMNEFKLIRNTTTQRIELYQLTDDPHESQNLAESHLAMVSEFLGILDRAETMAASRTYEPQDYAISAEELEKLRSLGYLGK